jgi:hypothetical protein
MVEIEESAQAVAPLHVGGPALRRRPAAAVSDGYAVVKVIVNDVFPSVSR